MEVYLGCVKNLEIKNLILVDQFSEGQKDFGMKIFLNKLRIVSYFNIYFDSIFIENVREILKYALNLQFSEQPDYNYLISNLNKTLDFITSDLDN